jgi:predicted lipoprotein with Yx(FWY)xxD motif
VKLPALKLPALLLVPLALIAAACGSSSSNSSSSKTTSTAAPASSSTPSSSSSSSVALATRTLPGLGTVLVNGQGRTLYTFAPDKATKVTCVGGCAAVWPPLKISSGAKPTMSGGVQASLVSSDTNPAGGSVVTYHGWPLYLYVADPTAGTDHGEGINSSGGLWYVISPSGKVITKSTGSSSSSSSSGGSSGY